MVEIIADKDRRIINGWGTVSVVDRQNDYIDVLKEFRDAGVMEKMMKRGAVVIDSHSNHVVGHIIKFEYKTTPSGNPGLYLTAEIFKDYPSDDEFWQAVLDKKYTGFSLGGKATTKTTICNNLGCHNNLEGIESWEWSCVETPANQEAVFDNVNKLAKSLTFTKDDAKKIGDKLKIDWNKISIDEFTTGINIELEHGKKNLETNVTNDDEILTAKIALAHLNEFPNYYSKKQGLPKLEEQLKIDVKKIANKWNLFKQDGARFGVHTNQNSINRQLEAIQKAKAYIANPKHVPAGVKVHIGSKGGWYYNTDENYGKPSSHSKVYLKKPSDAPAGVKVRQDEEGYYYNSDEV